MPPSPQPAPTRRAVVSPWRYRLGRWVGARTRRLLAHRPAPMVGVWWEIEGADLYDALTAAHRGTPPGLVYAALVDAATEVE